ncbi:Sapep family Mn(2+)-dependent dipeptidase [Ruminococcus sp. Marseille-P6503]|uniref:Sapep family Mn(2+)-dependent dipeptidase n=1 Tax=Ruminococcus sp. Marseille-P6503 TaxID=2364796 RepID=UPI001FA9C269|nr:Sapep family Mn(2+)-dependent dipeptidase [Ruminococcus sp. Marseille-P6503]
MFEKEIAEYFDKNIDNVIKSMREIMSIDSSLSEPLEGMPFGRGSAEALKWGADFGRSLGMKVKNFDNYAVSMDYGEGEPILGILSHLDVVPAGGGWSFSPFDCTVKDGNIYGRGAIDDKGPSVAVLYAVRCIKELGLPLKKGFRVIFGGNEEGGCQDIEYYQKKEPFPSMVFTPDGSFPVLNCEKGMLHLTFSGEGSFDCGGIRFGKIAGGTVINAVPGKTSCTAVYDEGSIPEEICGCNVKRSEEGFEITGLSSHGSRPELGRNTVTALLAFLAANGCETADRLSAAFPHGEFGGSSAGLGFSDSVSGEMTCVLTQLGYENGVITGGIDIRFPIDRTCAEIERIIKNTLENAGMDVTSCEGMEPHYVPEDSELVQALLRTYEKVKGEKGKCIAEGGITYVHNTAGGVAFGAEFPWENNNMHGPDEHISVETLKYNLNMYANAIMEICG